MDIQSIKQAVDSGNTVHWSNNSYTVIKDNLGQYLIKHESGDCTGLTNKAGTALNGHESEFYIDKGSK